MKTKWLLFLLLIPLFACTTQSTSPLSKAEKDKIQGEVKAAANEICKVCDGYMELRLIMLYGVNNMDAVYSSESLCYKTSA